MFDDWEDLEVEEEEPEVPSQKHEVAPAEVGGVALAEMAPFLRDFELSSGSGAAERSEVDEGGGRGRELAMGSGRAPREEDKEEECVTIEEVFVRDTGAGEPARAHEYDDDVDGGEGYGRLEGSNLVLLPGPIGQLQRALKRRRERDGGLQLQRSGAGQAATTLVPAGRASEDALDLVRGMEDEQDFAGVHWRRAMDALDAKDTSDVRTTKCGVVAIADVAQCGPSRKVPRLVALVKGLEACPDGSAYVTLKDNTGTVGATFHSEVLRNPISKEGELRVGAVLVLEKVSVFSPDDRSHFLCVTLDNVLQVFS